MKMGPKPHPRSATEPAPIPGVRFIALTQDEWAKVDESDFALVSNYVWHTSRDRRGRPYAMTNVGSKRVKLHRMILGMTDRKVDVDHINRDTLDCTRKNMRFATRSQNSANAIGKARNGYKGVFSPKHGRVIAQIMVNRKTIYLGRFDSKEEAAKAYDVAARKHFGEFACVNFPKDGERGCL